MKLSLVTLLLPVLAIAAPTPVVKRETALNAFLTVLLDYLPALDASINSLVGVLTIFEELLALLTGEQTTYNGEFLLNMYLYIHPQKLTSNQQNWAVPAKNTP